MIISDVFLSIKGMAKKKAVDRSGDPDVWNEWVMYKKFDLDLLILKVY